MPWWVYICEKQGRLYVGITTDLKNRMRQHRGRLLYKEVYKTLNEAALRERQVEKWKRGKKLALIMNRRPG